MLKIVENLLAVVDLPGTLRVSSQRSPRHPSWWRGVVPLLSNNPTPLSTFGGLGPQVKNSGQALDIDEHTVDSAN